MGPVQQRLATVLNERFAPRRLDIVDESHLHAGHMGARPEGETHFRVTIAADAFRGTTRLARHRMVNEAAADLLAGPIHALAIKAEVPDAG
ncbi:BolA family protein [Acuticoccus mangrovi]|uniref:BolA family transcriptional regulator n=1 Tax=Acuticoccus mangrovi TaxID=2796142 RepID=A0A934MFN7_9HYPH|nr:BolA family protein [Acuticoccus mangrovi]MBJ3778857.1 BolA family transcriptional regulator [Acuticoccus mangrovi]